MKEVQSSGFLEVTQDQVHFYTWPPDTSNGVYLEIYGTPPAGTFQDDANGYPIIDPFSINTTSTIFRDTRDGRGFANLSGVQANSGTITLTPPATVASCNGQQATMVGTDGVDILIGTVGADVIAGLGGDDFIFGLGGNDIVCGGDGDDFIRGGDGKDRIWGGNGEDVLRGGLGKDRLYGGKHDDMLKGGQDNDRLYGGKGSDVLVGGKGNDRHKCGSGEDIANGGRGDKDTQTNCEASLAIP